RAAAPGRSATGGRSGTRGWWPQRPWHRARARAPRVRARRARGRADVASTRAARSCGPAEQHLAERVAVVELVLLEPARLLLQLLDRPEVALLDDLVDDHEWLEQVHLTAVHEEHPAVDRAVLGAEVRDER